MDFVQQLFHKNGAAPSSAMAEFEEILFNGGMTLSDGSPVEVDGERSALASGAYGSVYKCCISNQCSFVVKLSDISKRSRAEVFTNEVDIYSRIVGHPATPKIYGAGVINLNKYRINMGLLPKVKNKFAGYLVMERLDGTIKELFSSGVLTVRERTSLYNQALKALRYIHDVGLVLLDGHASNMMYKSVNGNLEFRFMDFGLSRDMAYEMERNMNAFTNTLDMPYGKMDVTIGRVIDHLRLAAALHPNKQTRERVQDAFESGDWFYNGVWNGESPTMEDEDFPHELMPIVVNATCPGNKNGIVVVSNSNDPAQRTKCTSPNTMQTEDQQEVVEDNPEYRIWFKNKKGKVCPAGIGQSRCKDFIKETYQ